MAEGNKQLYLYKVATGNLGLVSFNFTHVADCNTRRGHFYVIYDNTSAIQYSQAECECPVRFLLPPAPSKVPYDVCLDNLPKIEAWVKELYATSVVNTCSHQRLPLMSTSPPLELYIECESTPTVVHKAGWRR